MIIPFVILDVFIEIYHHVCFPLYGLTMIIRGNYIKIDRHRLAYLSPLDKVHCAYCGYANGLLHYSSIIAGETEKYWCGIKHKKTPGFVEPEHHKDFLKYGDEKSFHEKYGKSF
jgi:hypothetical protein